MENFMASYPDLQLGWGLESGLIDSYSSLKKGLKIKYQTLRVHQKLRCSLNFTNENVYFDIT